MTRKEAVLHEVERLPEEYLDELLVFIKWLRLKTGRANLDTAYASEAVLARDWLTDKEDAAWRDL